MFEMDQEEFDDRRSQIVTSNAEIGWACGMPPSPSPNTETTYFTKLVIDRHRCVLRIIADHTPFSTFGRFRTDIIGF